ncbi:hypothetical protein GCM10007962_22150 [Yeosuana aromativorans]|uniref:Rhodanese domain-containing protein n=1 Tax=Yeosuana aromativorans TaxID=288019 RepID=A0A8J3FH48_9FLAO|nr:rhodanese-like domain-containing protein [Yeosuana aromativorans]GGK27478.1 hypothetical protein GCM10007962_22150 [Yeosuana aromativorans]
MKELEKVKRISIASTLFILAVLIGVVTYERPKNMYTINTKSTLEKLTKNDYLASIDNIHNENVSLIDVRSQYEYEKGHLESAINMSTPEILSDDSQSILKELKEDNKTVVLYGNNPQESNIPFLLLTQLGYDNIKLLNVEISYFQNQLVTDQIAIEKPIADIKAFINESIKNSDTGIEIDNNKPAKKIIIVQKKKKKGAEGGC